jgi:prevent-host-death family protein
METHIPIGELKTHCYQILDRVQKEKQNLVITKRGTPIAKLVSLQPHSPKQSLLGILQSKAKISGDLLAPLDEQWEAENGG